MATARSSYQRGAIIPLIIFAVLLLALAAFLVTSDPLNLGGNNNQNAPIASDAKSLRFRAVPTSSYYLEISYDYNLPKKLKLNDVRKISSMAPSPAPSPTPRGSYSITLYDKDKIELASYPFSIPNNTIDPQSLLSNDGSGTVITVPKVDFALTIPAMPELETILIADPNGRPVINTPIKKNSLTEEQQQKTQANAAAVDRRVAADSRVLGDSNATCANAGSNVCAVVKAKYSQPWKVGDPLTLEWETANVGPQGAVALNGPMVERYVKGSGSLVVNRPYFSNSTAPGDDKFKFTYTIKVDNGTGQTATDQVTITAPPVNEQTAEVQQKLPIVFLGDDYKAKGAQGLADTYDKEAKSLEDYIRSLAPYNRLQNNITFYRIDTPCDIKNDSDCNNTGTNRGPYDFGCTRPIAVSASYLECEDKEKIIASVSKYFGRYQAWSVNMAVAVLVNTDRFGSSYGKFTIFDSDNSIVTVAKYIPGPQTGPPDPKFFEPLIVSKSSATEAIKPLFAHILAYAFDIQPEYNYILHQGGSPTGDLKNAIVNNCYSPGAGNFSDSNKPDLPEPWKKLGVPLAEFKQGCGWGNWWRSADNSLMRRLNATKYSPAAEYILQVKLQQ